MCIILSAMPNKKVPDKHIENSFYNNFDGAGYMFVVNQEVIIKKGYDLPEPLIKDYHSDFKKHPDSRFVIHCRIGTSGKNGELNCHPFYSPTHKFGFAHNGILSRFEVTNSPWSDTQHFVNDVLEKLPKHFWVQPGLRKLLELTAKETSSKFVFLLPSNRTWIVNEEAGTWVDGVWYSNSGYKESFFGYGKALKGQFATYAVEFCEFCGRSYDPEDMNEIQDAFICDSCYDYLYHKDEWEESVA